MRANGFYERMAPGRGPPSSRLSPRSVSLAEGLIIAIELPSNEAVLAAVLAGAGATILSARVCADAVKAGALKILPVSLAPRSFCAVQHADRYRSRAVSALLEILRAHAGL